MGRFLRMTTWGESHGSELGAVLDGYPAGIKLDLALVQAWLDARRPRGSKLSTGRNEPDRFEICSGVVDGVTTGAPLAIRIVNQGQRRSDYQDLAGVLRPGHADYTYKNKYGVYAHAGGGRASGRLTALNVACGALAWQLLAPLGIKVGAFIRQLGSVEVPGEYFDLAKLEEMLIQAELWCPDPGCAQQMEELLNELRERGESCGCIVEFVATGVPQGLGEPLYAKLEAQLAQAMLSIPATKGFSIGQGFGVVDFAGSEHNDGYRVVDTNIELTSNMAGGILGGISTGAPIYGQVAFKPTSSVGVAQQTVVADGSEGEIKLNPKRHDPCIGVRGVVVVKANLALVLADAYLASLVQEKYSS